MVKVEPPEGDALRRWTASGAPLADGRDAPLFSYLAGGKQSVVVGPDASGRPRTSTSCSTARTRWCGRQARPRRGLAAGPRQSLLSGHPHLAVAAITPFGLDGPWRDRPATEFTLQAWSGGIVGLGRGAPDRAPVYVGGQVGEWLSGAYAAVGIQAAWARARRTGTGQLIDLSMLEVAVLCLTYYPVTFFETLGRPWRTDRSLFQPGVAAAKDGLVASGAAPHSSGSTCASWWATPSGSTAPRRSASASRPTGPHRSCAMDRRPHGRGDQRPAAAFRIPNAPVSSGATVTGLSTSGSAGCSAANPTRGVPAAGRAVPALA